MLWNHVSIQGNMLFRTSATIVNGPKSPCAGRSKASSRSRFPGRATNERGCVTMPSIYACWQWWPIASNPGSVHGAQPSHEIPVDRSLLRGCDIYAAAGTRIARSNAYADHECDRPLRWSFARRRAVEGFDASGRQRL